MKKIIKNRARKILANSSGRDPIDINLTVTVYKIEL